MGESRKPRFKLAEWLVVEPFLRRMAESLRDGYGHEWWPQVASDTLDGWAYADEVRPLVRRRILTVIDDGGCGCKHFCAKPAAVYRRVRHDEAHLAPDRTRAAAARS